MAKYQGFYLPKLVGTNVAPPRREGVWGTQEDRIVTDLANSIDIGEPLADGQNGPDISSIPDVYARPLLFQSAFRNERHPAHYGCVQEWRGLLSLLALHEVKSGLKESLRFVPVSFDGREANPLVRAVQQLRPPGVKLQDNVTYEWDKLLLVQFDGITLGAFSPSTLVFTAAEYDLRTNGGQRAHIGQFTDTRGRLCPPSATEAPDDLLAVGEWLQWLKPEGQLEATGLSKLFGFDASAGEVRNTIFGELQKWVAEIRKAFPGNPDLNALKYRPGVAPRETVRLPGAPWLEDYGVYQLLLTPLRLDEKNTGGVESDCALRLVERERAPFKHVIVVQPGMDKRLRLWNDVKLETLGNNPFDILFREASGPTLGGYDIKDGDEPGIWIRPELFFLTATLTKASGPGSFLNESEANANGGRTQFLLPLRACILDYFTVEEIKQDLKPTYVVDGIGPDIKSVTFSLQLPLRNGGSVAVAKTYVLANPAPGQGEVVERQVPVLEVFPNYVGAFWSRYYLLSSDTERLQAKPVNKAARESTYFVSPTQQRRTDNLRVEITRIGGENSFPEAISLQERAGRGDEAGLVLLERYSGTAGNELRDVQFNSRESAIFGIDFGTSNTNVFIKQGETAIPLTLQFSKHLRPLTAAPDALSKEINHAFLVPADDRSLPVPTALRVFDPGVRDALLLDYFLYVPKYSYEHLAKIAPKSEDFSYPPNVQVDLKWQEDDRDSTNNFIDSLIFLLALEAVRRRIGKVEFRCTYPKAFSDSHLKSYKNSWEQSLRSIVADSPEKLGAGHAFMGGHWTLNGSTYTLTAQGLGQFTIETEPFFRREGEAAGVYFNKEAGLSLQSGAVCIDVGGGTTDYSLLYEGSSLYDASVLLAGREISQMLMNNDALCAFLLSSQAATEALQSAAKASNRDITYPSRLNFVLQAEHKNISEKLARNGTASIIRPLLRVLLIEFGALAYYAGHLVLALNKFRGQRRLADTVAQRGMGLYWGGNASKMLDWMDEGRFKPNESTAKMLNFLFGSVLTNKELDDTERFIIKSASLLGQHQSKGQKNEAAGGVVQMSTYVAPALEEEGDDIFDLSDATPADGERTLQGLVLGERVTLNGKEYPPHHVFSDKDVKRLLKEPLNADTELEQLDRLLLGINKWGGLDDNEKITLSSRQRLDIRNHLHDLYAGQLSLAEEDRTLEPSLIVEVRYLLKLIRDNKL